MTPFETAFPGFVEACAALHSDLMPFAIIVSGKTGACLSRSLGR
jgi:hypothetical protein